MTAFELARLHAAAFTTERPWSAEEFANLCADRHTHLTTAAHGFALWRAVADEAELLTIAVDPVHQGQGVGHALMQNWMTQAAKLANTAFLEVAADNHAACRLYVKSGFETVAERPAYYARPHGKADAWVMRAPLS
ncbi:ribosomal protein S18-alanine N-acetyltransferase [uncultured Tateyamaria sp.]|uniref:ribosomal protein S18-alanine N-acetyltransferase n=1 Tax=Tateyamaria sp. 1078 TaxID=3417464 RepID=UPI0026053B3B|nr:ribosomal protein S18-alanine N-acetyltransferase [uncultured Tateyamaria sp.]